MIDVTSTNIAAVDLHWAEPKDDQRECCMNCGRVLKDASGWMVCVAEGGTVVVDPKDWDRNDIVTDSGYMGV